MAVEDHAGGTPAVTSGGLVGPLLAVLGGLLVAASTVLPWVQITFALPNGQGTSETLGVQLTSGVLVLVAGLLTAATGAGVAMARIPRATAAWGIAVGPALAIALTGGWWFRGYGTAVTAVGILVCLAAAALSHPGPTSRRIWLVLGAAVAGVVVAVVLGLLVPYQSPKF